MDQNNGDNDEVKFQDTGWQTTMKQEQFVGTPKIVGWTMKLSGGLLKTEKQATYALLGFVLIAIIVSLFLFFGIGGNSQKIPPLTPEQRSFMETGHGL